MKQNTQTGRSMVEMLGTLAIIGVLSVGGIVGFNTAMDKHKTNDIVSFLNGTTVLTQALLVNGNLTLDSAQDTIDQLNSSYLATAVMCSSGYAVNMAGLPKGVCENFTDMADDNHYIDELKLFIGTDCTPGSVSCTSDDENAISFIFDTNVLSDNLDNTGFYWCEDGTIQNKEGKVATCDCAESDEEFYYDSDEEAIAAMCKKEETTTPNAKPRSYWCSSGGILTDQGWVTSYCGCSGGEATYYDSDEEAIAAMCLKEYTCSSYELLRWTVGGNSVVAENCRCQTGGGSYNSDEEAIAAMCKKEETTTPNAKPRSYWCSSGGILTDQGWVTSYCGCSGGEATYYNSDEEAIANMCVVSLDAYWCTQGTLASAGNSVVSDCACSHGVRGYYRSDEEAIAAMCPTQTVTQTQTVTPNSGDMYACSGYDGKDFVVNKNNESYVTSCICNASKAGYYNSDEEAIAAMCQN